MDLVRVAISSISTLITLFVLTKLMGNREMAQLSMFDYVSSITIGSIAGKMAVESKESILLPFVALVIFAVFTILISLATCKSIKLRRFFEGHALLIYQNGQIYEKNLLKAKLDINELLAACRLNGYYDLSEVHSIYLEANGQISVLPKAHYRPLTPLDLKIEPLQSAPLPTIIIDGRVLAKNLELTEKSMEWVQDQLREYGVQDQNDVILSNYDPVKDRLNVYMKLHKKMTEDIFQ